MSEQKTNYMQLLDSWTEQNVIEAFYNTDPNQEDWEDRVQQVKKAIREKTLESYKNGCKAGAGAVRKEMRQH